MTIICIGGDVSKGRMDVAIINQSGTQLDGSGSYDDSQSGHVRLREKVRRLEERFPEAEIRFGLESTGGYERNWQALFRAEAKRGKNVHCWRLNPLAVKRWLDADLHRQVDDRRAALGIAQYLLERRPKVIDPEPTPMQSVYRLIRSATGQQTKLVQQLEIMLQQIHPELVHACRSGLPKWLLSVLAQYPTADAVARARSGLASIPHVGAERAAELVAAAKTSVASLTGPAAEDCIGLLVEQIRAQQDIIERYKGRLITAMAGDESVRLLETIPGIGVWTAIALVLEIGDARRFEDPRQLIAWAGLDPHDHTSGDQVIRHGISKRGNAHIRAQLYMPMLSAMMSNPVIKRFYERLVARGKCKMEAIVACMGKMLRIVYALLVSRKPFDPDYEAQRSKRRPQMTAAVTPAPAPATGAPVDLKAPITRREVRRRRLLIERQQKAAAPGTESTGSESQAETGATAPGASAGT